MMMKKNILTSTAPVLLGLLFATFHIACKKDPEPRIAGQVVEYGTYKPIEGAVVSLSGCDGELLGPISCSTIATATSEADGSFSFPKLEGAMTLNAEKLRYFTDDYSSISGLDKPENTILLPPYAWIKARLVNESGAYMISVPSYRNEIDRQIYIPKGGDTTLYMLKKGNQNYKYLFVAFPKEGGNAELDLAKYKVSVNGDPAILSNNILSGPHFEIYLVGQDTQNIELVY